MQATKVAESESEERLGSCIGTDVVKGQHSCSCSCNIHTVYD